MVRHFLKDTDLTPTEQARVLRLAAEFKADRFSQQPLSGPQTVVVIFDKTSTRTRVSFATGIVEMGGFPLVMDSGESQLGHKESIEDTSRVLTRMASAIVWRTSAQEGLEKMAAHATVPVVNALSDQYHPCQILADLQTMQENLGDLRGKTLAYLGDAANNMAHSYLLGGVTAGMNVHIAGPADYQPDPTVVQEAHQRAEETGATILITDNPEKALLGSDVVITDTWISMGQEEEKDQRESIFRPYQVDSGAMAQANDHAIFMHCLPAYRGFEVTADVIDGPQSVVWDEAENRLHAQKALLTFLLEESITR